MAVLINITDTDASNAAEALRHLTLTETQNRALRWLILGSGDSWEVAKLLEKDIFQKQFGLNHHRRAVHSVLAHPGIKALKAHRTRNLGKMLGYLPQKSGYEKLRSSLLDIVLAGPVESWLLEWEGITDWKYRLTQREMDRVVKAVLQAGNADYTASLLALNGRHRGAYLVHASAQTINRLLNVITDGASFEAALNIYLYHETWLCRPLTKWRKKRLIATMARLALVKVGTLAGATKFVTTNEVGMGAQPNMIPEAIRDVIVGQMKELAVDQ